MHNIPLDIKAETILAYLPKDKTAIELKGSHNRNAYEDIVAINEDESGIINVAIARNGIYDILPESLFHPIDRFDNIPANEYKERFKEECEQQQIEEDNARKFFKSFDNILMELSTIVYELKNDISYSNILKDILCDRLSERYKNNSFIKKATEYLPICHRIRGNKSLLLLMLRRILFDEHIRISECLRQNIIRDSEPRYNYRLVDSISSDEDYFLGNEFDEDITTYSILYWNEDEYGQDFLAFVKEMSVFEDFLNEYFMGIETYMKFNITKTSLPVRLSDEVFYTYLNYNTNI